MKKRSMKKHTGRLHHPDMSSLMFGGKGRDKDAHSSHHSANKAYAMPEGMSPKDEGCTDCPEGDMSTEREM